MNRTLLAALVALAFMPAVRDFAHNSDAGSGRAETRRDAPTPTTIAQRCFNTGNGVRCF